MQDINNNGTYWRTGWQARIHIHTPSCRPFACLTHWPFIFLHAPSPFLEHPLPHEYDRRHHHEITKPPIPTSARLVWGAAYVRTSSTLKRGALGAYLQLLASTPFPSREPDGNLPLEQGPLPYSASPPWKTNPKKRKEKKIKKLERDWSRCYSKELCNWVSHPACYP